VATFGSEQQLLAYVRWAMLQDLGGRRGKFEQGSSLAGYDSWEPSDEPLTQEDETPLITIPRPACFRGDWDSDGYLDLHIVALQTHGHWTASFAHSPDMGFGGKTARDAAQLLLHAASGIDLDEQHLLETSAVESEARLELVVRVM